MLDLKLLSQSIEEALENETAESLNAWLMSKRQLNVKSYIGEGDYIVHDFNCLIQEPEELLPQKFVIVGSEIITSQAGNTQYAMAA